MEIVRDNHVILFVRGPHESSRVGADDVQALRGGAGLQFALPVARVDSLPPEDLVPGPSRTLVAIDPVGEPFSPDRIPPGAVLAFGSERNGLSRELLARAGLRLAIPMRPGVSSLNLATAVAVLLYAWRSGEGSRRPPSK